MVKISILKKDTRPMVQKIFDNLNNQLDSKSNSSNKSEKSNNQKQIKQSNIRDDISKVGLTNSLMGTTQVLNNQNNILKENTMSNQIVIPIKSIILEFTADHIRDNAGKYAAGTMLGLGAAAGYLAGDPSHGEHLLGSHSGNETHNVPTNHNDNVNGATTIKLQNGSTHTVNYKTGEGAGLMDHLKQFGEDRANTNYHHNVMDAVNSDPSFFTTNEKLGMGAAGLGIAGLGAASTMRRPTMQIKR